MLKELYGKGGLSKIVPKKNCKNIFNKMNKNVIWSKFKKVE